MRIGHVVIPLLLVALPSALSSRYIGSYTARLGPDDHSSSRGILLRRPADILQQDRANFHRFGIRDPEDEGDPYFTTRSRRSRMGRMLRRGSIEPGLAREIVSGTPLVKVDIYSRSIEVRRAAEPAGKLQVPASSSGPASSGGAGTSGGKDLRQDALRRVELHGSAPSFKLDFGQFPLAPLRHEVIGLYPCRENSVEKLFVVTATNARDKQINHCHGCGPALSVLVYRRGQSGWRFESADFGIGKFGNWGDAPAADDLAMIHTGPSSCGLVLRTGYAGMGWSYDYYTLFLHEGGKFREVFATTLSADSSGTGALRSTRWNTRLRFRPGTKPYYDLHLRREGIEEGRAFGYEVIYSYDGKRYRPDRNDPLAKQ